MQIRKADLKDFEIINKLAVNTWPHAYGKILSQEQITYMLDEMYSQKAITDQISIKGHHFIILSSDEKDVGFAAYELNHLSGITKLHKLYVLPETQGLGAGRLLIAKVEELAKTNRNDSIILNVNRFNEAVNFYAKNGYVKVREEDIDIGNGYLMEDYIMQKQL